MVTFFLDFFVGFVLMVVAERREDFDSNPSTRLSDLRAVVKHEQNPRCEHFLATRLIFVYTCITRLSDCFSDRNHVFLHVWTASFPCIYVCICMYV